MSKFRKVLKVLLVLCIGLMLGSLLSSNFGEAASSDKIEEKSDPWEMEKREEAFKQWTQEKELYDSRVSKKKADIDVRLDSIKDEHNAQFEANKKAFEEAQKFISQNQ